MHDDAKWVEGFPNLKTMWGYAGFSPLAPTGHLTQWERLTRGRADHLSDSSVRQSTAAVAWSARGGVVLPGATAGDLGAARALADLRFEEFLSGATPVKTPDDERARHTYSTYRVLSRHPDTPRDERAKLAARADQMVRIRFYETAVERRSSVRTAQMWRRVTAVWACPCPTSRSSTAARGYDTSRRSRRSSVVRTLFPTGRRRSPARSRGSGSWTATSSPTTGCGEVLPTPSSWGAPAGRGRPLA